MLRSSLRTPLIKRHIVPNFVGASFVSPSFLLFIVAANSNNFAATPFTPMRCYGYGKGERGTTRLSYEERIARRTPKTREQKQEAEQRMLEAEQYVDSELPDICQADQEKILAKAEHAVQKLFHPAQALFDVLVEMHGQQKPLSQLATIVKVSAREYDIVPNNHAFTSPILVRIPRYDNSLNAHKVGDKIRVTMPQMTRTKRVAVADYINDLGTKTKKHYMTVRRNAINHIDELGINDDAAAIRKEECEQIVKNCEDELEKKLEELSQSVLLAQDDEDDADGSVQ